MNDEMQQMYREAFDRIVLGLTFIGLMGGLVTLLMRGFSSAQFLYAAILVGIVLVAFILRQVGQFVVACYGLVLALTGLVAGMFLLASPIPSFIPYLFIPIVVIAGFILSPPATIATAILAIVVSLGLVTLLQQLTWATFIALWLPFGLLILTALITSQSRRYVLKLDRCLLENRNLLRQRTLELLRALEEGKELQKKVVCLKEQILTAQADTDRACRVVAQRGNKLHELIKGTIQELNASTKKLEDVIENILEAPQPDVQTNLVEEAWQKIDYLNSLAINLGQIAQLENEEVQLNYQSIDVAGMLSELTGAMQGLARSKNLELHCRAAADLPVLTADPAQVRQALLQVMNNAVKYTDQGVIEVYTEATDLNLMIFISDTGPGIASSEIETLFQKFGQSSQPSGRGPGLGLMISKRIIELHGGRIWATSVLGVGSTFYITLPLKPAPNKAPATGLPASPAAISNRVKPAVSTLPAAQASPPHSPQPATSPIQSHLGPVARYSLTYNSRFGLILLSIFLAIIDLVAVLALLRGPLPDEAAAIMTITPAPSVYIASNRVTPTNTATPVERVPPTLISASSPTPQPTATPTLSPTVLPSPTRIFIPTRISALPTPAPEFVPPLPSPTPRATATPTLTPEPTPTPPVLAMVTAPATSPTRSQLAVVTAAEENEAVAFLNSDDSLGASLDLTMKTALNSSLGWSATGQVLFTGDQNGDREIYLACVNPTGGCSNDPINLTQAEGDDQQPAWSPDDRSIAFSSGRTGNLDIYVMPADCIGLSEGCTQNLTQLTNSRGFDEWPVWSPDGRRIAFISDRDGNAEIYIMQADGSDQQRMTNNPADDWPVSWSPDSRQLLFASNRDANWNLYLVEMNGANLVRLTNDPANERNPVWSPDGRTIAFAYDGNGNWDIYTVPASSSNLTDIPRSQWIQMTRTSTDELYPVWLP